jgi:hypothetical protein
VYGWTWVDTAPWGWAPYHYGRWCFVDGYWAWAPGPVIARAVYAPALVAFLGEPGVVVGAAGPPVSWVALGWGEPVVPWWGRRGVAHGPSWRGWGGPRVVNNVVVSNTTVVNVQNITVYRNATVPHAVVAVDGDRFGRGRVPVRHVVQVDPQRLRPLPGGPQIPATPGSLAPTSAHGVRPAPEVLKRLEVAPERLRREREAAESNAPRPASAPPPHAAVAPASPEGPVTPLPRPSFGHGTTERPMTDRRAASTPPRLNGRGGPVSPGPAGALPADRSLRTEPPRGQASPQLASHPAVPAPVVKPGGSVPAGHAPTAPPVIAHPPTGPAPVDARSVRGKDLTPAPAPAARQGVTAPASNARAETTSGPKRGGGAPAMASHPGGPPTAAAHRPEPAHQTIHGLPGEPANRLAPGRATPGPRGPVKPEQPKG